MTPLYTFVRGMLRLALRAFFREIAVHGADNVPRSGPVVIVANHHNGMIDPFLLIAASPRPVTFIAKSTLFRIPVLGWFLRGLQSIPASRSQDPGYAKESNEQLYASAAGALRQGRALGIFPEGRSHLDPRLAELKHGASRIALESGPATRVQLVGIHFDRTRGFRGRALLQFGPAIALDSLSVRYAQDPRAAVAALTEEMHTRLSDMVLTAENDETVRLASLVERMGVLDASGDGDLKSAFARKKALLEGYARLRQTAPQDVERLTDDLRHYRSFLQELGVRDDQIAADYSARRVLGYALRTTIVLLAGLPVMAAGLAGNIVPYVLARAFAWFGRSLDVRTSIGFMVSLVAFPSTWAAIGYVASRLWGWPAGLGAAIAAPMAGVVALRWFDRWKEVVSATWGLWTAIALPGARSRLRSMRARIVNRVERLVERYRTPA